MSQRGIPQGARKVGGHKGILCRLGLGGKQDGQSENYHSGDNGRIGNVENGPGPNIDEISDVSHDKAVDQIAAGACQDQSQRDFVDQSIQIREAPVNHKGIEKKQDDPNESYEGQNTGFTVKDTESSPGILGISQVKNAGLREGLIHLKVSSDPALAELVDCNYRDHDSRKNKVPLKLRSVGS